MCETLEAAGVTPFYATFADSWTIGQGWYDYTVGGMLDTLDFFDELAEEGTERRARTRRSRSRRIRPSPSTRC